MKNKGLIITLIILLAIIVIGLIGILVFFLNGKMNFKNGIISFGTRNSQVVFDETYDNKGVEDIEILLDAGDITFEKSSEENIRVVAYGQNSEDVKVDLSENRLKVDYTKYSRPWFNFNVYSNDIIVYIPESYSDEINIKNDYGNCTLTDLENATISIDSDCGNIELGKVKNIKIKCDYGNVDIDTVLNKCDIQSDCGNVDINKIQIQENSSIKSDYGNVEIEEINDIYVDAKVDLGQVKVDNNNRQSNITLKIKADCGDVKVGK